ncbi:sigma-70 family RNA polymerase sigma factor [Parabacteroides sp. 52]|uniref:RNA polymerase sigma factor n=1 Tax=unclassified Parabacteroides TaxID=2649774 RepID=UPI0013CF90DC|nr:MULTISPECIES: sigma-70 family RNA polymerase sigma factor [unclassified Parabacteroides]MDH6535039.1 RNA polymerase sigma factor (sigma-70 family) [Parabacteroides sp. PM5-20]NDV55299.1 sigma-70 family RNA polymerase sigma factor [Parabacteroides sp. 52]
MLKEFQDDADVWKQFKAGNSDAFAVLFEQSSDKLFRYGSKFVQDEELVKDCIQDVFVKLHQKRNKLPDMENPFFYLCVSLKNTLIDNISRSDREVALPPEELPFYIEFAYDDEQPEEEDVISKFEAVMSLLSDRQKEAIYLRYQMDLSYEEISQLLSINYQSTRNLVHRALEKVRTTMDLKLFLLLVGLYLK